MEFHTSSAKKRPIRLCEKTRQFAYDSLNHKYGLDTLETPNVSLDHIEGFENMTDMEQYNRAVYEIVSKAPVRIVDGELISGSATLDDAILHKLPVSHRKIEFDGTTGVSHLTLDFYEIVENGVDHIRQRAQKSLEKHTDPMKKEFLESCIHCIDCLEIWHKRYLAELESRGKYEKTIENLRKVPFGPATNFYEAVQSIWFCFAFARLFGNWPAIGRIDYLLGKYLKKDLQGKNITINEAREILAHFFIKGCEWITGKNVYSGDAQHYQNIVLSGVDEEGKDITNEVTYLVLDIIEETGISDFPTTVRINKFTPDEFVQRVAEVILYGGGTIAIYNEDLIIEAFLEKGYPLKEARNFANDGCWEVQIPGKTRFNYMCFDSLKILQEVTLDRYSGKLSYTSFDELYSQYKRDLGSQVEAIYNNRIDALFEKDRTTFKKMFPCTIVSLFEDGCIEKGLSYKEGGPVYSVFSPHIGGLPDTVNSLYAIKKAVFDDKIIPLDKFISVLKNNWENEEELRREILGKYLYFGNDNDEVDEIAKNILDDFASFCEQYDGTVPIRFISGVSTFGRQIDWAPSRSATPFGRKKGEILSGNFSPTPGTDQCGALATIKSYCKADLKRHQIGSALDIGLIPTNADNENAPVALAGMIKGFVTLGGFFMQIDTVDKNMLREAQSSPEAYQNLSVRVSGWNARFVTMNKEWQDMVIERAK